MNDQITDGDIAKLIADSPERITCVEFPYQNNEEALAYYKAVATRMNKNKDRVEKRGRFVVGLRGETKFGKDIIVCGPWGHIDTFFELAKFNSVRIAKVSDDVTSGSFEISEVTRNKEMFNR